MCSKIFKLFYKFTKCAMKYKRFYNYKDRWDIFLNKNECFHADEISVLRIKICNSFLKDNCLIKRHALLTLGLKIELFPDRNTYLVFVSLHYLKRNEKINYTNTLDLQLLSSVKFYVVLRLN